MAATKWVIDPMHSELQFKIKHLVISTVTGSFKTFEGEASVPQDGSFEDAQVQVKVDVDSIHTNQDARDQHLKSADFFDVAQYPHMEFTSTSFRKKSDDEYELKGNLTLHGVTKEITLNAEYGGMEKDGYGNTKAGFEVTGKFNRKDFGLSWNALTEAGGLTVSEEVKLVANIQLAKQA